MMQVPQEDQLYCGHDLGKKQCVDCASRDGTTLVCYRRTPEHGVCIEQRDCPAGKDCIAQCQAKIGCFGKICPQASPLPADCEAHCAENGGSSDASEMQSEVTCGRGPKPRLP